MEAVVGESAVSGGSFFFYDTALTVICKTAYAVSILFLEKLVFLIVVVSGFFFIFCFPYPASDSVIEITDDSTVSAFFQ